MTYDKITSDDLGILMGTDDERLAEWWCKMNRFGWPTELPNPEFPKYETNGRTWQLMQWIEETIGQRQISREWNMPRMTTEEFNDFWRGEHCGDEKCRERYNMRLGFT